MPPKKKPARNGFSQFMFHIKKTQGLSSNEEAQQVAGEMWKNMSTEERAPYKDQAITTRNNYERPKLTNTGVPINVVEQLQQEKALEVETMKNDIRMRLRSLKQEDRIRDQPFLIIHMNKLIYHETQDVYYVCEIAVSAFNLENGVLEENIFHRIINPGKLPLGYTADAIIYAKQTHNLAEFVLKDEINNEKEVFSEFIDFLKRFAENNNPPILYTQEKSLGMTRKVLEQWRDVYGIRKPIKVHSLEYFLYIIRNVLGGDVWPNDTLAYKEIDRDLYSHTPGISCEFHELIDCTVHCSKSVVTRFAYNICDMCCIFLDIQPIPGFHVPKDAEVVQVGSSRASSRAGSIISTSTTKYYTEPYDSSSVVLTDDDYYSDSLAPLAVKSTASSSISVSQASNQRSYAASVQRGSSSNSRCSDMKSLQARFGNLKLPRKGCDLNRN